MSMPLRAPCADPHCKDTMDVRTLATGTNQLWVHEDCIPWLVTYIADETGFGGVTAAYDDEDSSAVADSGVQGLKVEWDFQDNDGWSGTFVSGPLKGETYNMRLSKFDQEKWEVMNA